MYIKHIDQKWLKDQIRQLLAQYVGKECRGFFFGSRVRGDSFDRADIDIGIEGVGPIPAEKKLMFEEKLEELPTLYTFDVVDFSTVSEDFKQEALKYKQDI